MSHPHLSLQPSSKIYSDSRTHGYQGPTRTVHFYRATSPGGGAISKSQDGERCAITGKESLRIIQLTDGSQPLIAGYKSSVGRGGHRVDASRNFWDGSGLKIDCASTDVAWAHGAYDNKILTSARNGEVIVWDINKSGMTKYERRSKDHIRSINAVSVSHIVPYYCITGSADGDMRVWDLRDMSRSLLRVHHPTSVRSLAFSPSTWQPLHAIVGLDNGSIYRWDLKMGQRGLIDRLPVAHTASVTSLDWCNHGGVPSGGVTEGPGNGLGWLVSGSLDRHVKVWDLTAPLVNAKIPSKPTYTLHPSFPVRRVVWRPSYECELAVVSNVEFSTGPNPNPLQASTMGGASGEHKTPSSLPAGGEAIEIWDVRRSWIPKWSFAESVNEGGVTALTFRDADAIWAQHSSGTFSQIDLRGCTKLLDNITHTAVTWNASRSLTFVVDDESPWQIPYDDISSELPTSTETYQVKPKALGDELYVPLSQDLGTLMHDTNRETDAFQMLATGYVIHGESRPAICAVNAQVAAGAGRDNLSQTWLLLGASLADLWLESQSKPAQKSGFPDIKIPHPASAPAVYPNYTFPASLSTPSQLRKTSPGQLVPGVPHRSTSTSASRKMTPASSNASSPRQVTSALPSIPPRPSFLGAWESGEGSFPRRSSVSLYRRPSLPMSSSHSISPVTEKTSGGVSLRHAGEGAIDDSDSSSSDGSEKGRASQGESDDEDAPLSSLVSPFPSQNRVIPTPSPLSRVAGQHRWPEGEAKGRKTEGDDGDEGEGPTSSSPQSPDTESVGSSPPFSTIARSRSLGKHPSKRIDRSRSRSSTVASLAAAPTLSAKVLRPRALTREESRSSIRTVTVGEGMSLNPQVDPITSGSSLKPEETYRDMRDFQNRRKSVVSEPGLDGPLPVEVDGSGGGGGNRRTADVDLANLTDRRIEMVRADEKRFRDLSWAALCEAFEILADEGDVQTCAMLALVASGELGIPKRRVGRFLESYIELLTRHRLHTCAAYLRKYCQVDDVRKTTLLETTIYSTCGRCRKPIVASAGSKTSAQRFKGRYSFCPTCRTSSAVCSICRLPVRALLFQCSVCSHGGHQACYRKYYAHDRTVDIPGSGSGGPGPFVPISMGSKSDSESASSTRGNPLDEDVISNSSSADPPFLESDPISPHTSLRKRLVGYPCAAGCGHFCWASNVITEQG